VENRLRVVRAERRISQLNTSLASGVPPWRLWKIENDLAEATSSEREAIARALDVPVSALWPKRPATHEQHQTAAPRPYDAASRRRVGDGYGQRGAPPRGGREVNAERT
jgi:hypothetical protein